MANLWQFLTNFDQISFKNRFHQFRYFENKFITIFYDFQPIFHNIFHKFRPNLLKFLSFSTNCHKFPQIRPPTLASWSGLSAISVMSLSLACRTARHRFDGISPHTQAYVGWSAGPSSDTVCVSMRTLSHTHTRVEI